MNSKSQNLNQEDTVKKSMWKSQQINGENHYAVFDRMIEGVHVLGYDWRYLYLNDAAEKQNRRPNRELLGNKYMDMWPGIEETQVFSVIKHCLKEGDPSELENRSVYPDGTVRWFNLSIQPVPEGVLVISFDITEWVLAENAFRRSEERYRKLTENFPNGTVNIYDRDLRMTFVAGSDLKKYNMGPEAFIGKTFQELAPAETFSKAEPHLRAAFEGIPGSYETPYWNGQYYFVNVAPLEKADGSIDEILVVTQNLTERVQVDEALRESEERFRLFIEHAPASLAMFDREMRYLAVSRRWRADYNLEDQEILGHSHYKIFPEIPEQWKKIHQRGLSGEVIKAEHDKFVRLDGSVQWQRWEVRPWHDTSGNVGGIVIFTEDITEQVQVEEKLSESEQRFRHLFVASPDALMLIDPSDPDTDWPIVDCNEIACQMNGYTREELLGKSVDILNVTKGKPEERADYLEQIKRAGVLRLEALHRHRDGHIFPIETSTSIITFEGREMVLGIDRDITTRKQAEKALAESEQRFRGLIDHAPDGIVIYGSSGRIEYASPATERIMGYATEEILATDPAQITHPDDLPALEEALAELMQTPTKTIMLQYRLRHKDGSWRWLESHISNFSEVPGIEGLVFNFRDISERKAAGREIQQRTEDLLLINTLNDAANRGEDFEGIVEVFARETSKVFDCLAVAVYLLSPDAKFIEMQSNTIPRNLTDKIEKLIGRPIPRVRIEIKEGSLLKQILENEAGSLLNDPELVQQWVEEYSETTFLPRGFRPAMRKIIPRIYKILKIGSAISIPLVASGRTIGILELSSRGQFNEDDLERIRTISFQVTAVLMRKQIEKQVELQLQRMRGLNNIDRAISSSLDMRISLDVLLREVLSQLEVDAAAVLLLKPSTQTLEFVAGKGFRSQSIRQSHVRLGEGCAGRVGMERKLLHVPNLPEAGEDFTRAEPLMIEEFVEYLAVPLIAKGVLKGVLEIYHRASLDIDPDWKGYLETLGGQAAIAIDNAQLFEGMQRSNQELVMAYDATIAGWSRAMDLRDEETEGHTQRVTELTLKLAEKLGISQQEQVQIRRGALLHDIGKLGVPDGILLKPGKLTNEEWEIMRQHPKYAYEMLMPISYLRPAMDIPYCHHEKWNGSGYPRGLKGEQIPLAARIFAVVDVWDALTSDRPYRSAWTEEKTVEYIKEQSGKHFDPDIVEVFLETISRELK